MSSHHFVKEGQEPALLIMSNVSMERTQPLLEWSPLILVAAEALEKVLSWGIRVDAVVLSHHDEQYVRQRLSEFQAVDLILITNNDDLLPACVGFATRRLHSELNILCHHLEEVLSYMRHTDVMRMTVLADDYRWIFARSYRKWVSAGTLFKIDAGDNEPEVRVSGLVWRAESMMAEKDGFICVSSPNPLWIGESY
jgi:hypothetical protein